MLNVQWNNLDHQVSSGGQILQTFPKVLTVLRQPSTGIAQFRDSPVQGQSNSGAVHIRDSPLLERQPNTGIDQFRGVQIRDISVQDTVEFRDSTVQG